MFYLLMYCTSVQYTVMICKVVKVKHKQNNQFHTCWRYTEHLEANKQTRSRDGTTKFNLKKNSKFLFFQRQILCFLQLRNNKYRLLRKNFRDSTSICTNFRSNPNNRRLISNHYNDKGPTVADIYIPQLIHLSSVASGGGFIL